MRTIYAYFLFVSVIVCVIVVGAGCQPQPTESAEPTPLPTWTMDGAASEAIGRVSRVRDQVEHGREGEGLSQLMDAADLYGDDRIRVRNGGEAR